MQIFCSVCHKRIARTNPRVVVKGEYVCADCAYHQEKRAS